MSKLQTCESGTKLQTCESGTKLKLCVACPADAECDACPDYFAVTVGGGTSLDGTYYPYRTTCQWYAAQFIPPSGTLTTYLACGSGIWTVTISSTVSGCSITATAPISGPCPPTGGWTVTANTCGGTATVDVA